MKKILCTAVSALALAAFADGVNSTEFGALYVPSMDAKTIVSVPWLQSGTGTADVKVADLVLTAGLTDGDTLDLYDPTAGTEGKGGYTYSWSLDNGAWKPSQTTPADASIARGSALRLTRSVYAKGFYIMGKPTSGEKQVTLSAGENVYSLIAPPGVSKESSDVNNSDDMTWSGLAKGDMIAITTSGGAAKFYTWSTKKSKFVDSATGSTEGITITRGEGAWFISKGAGTKSVTFK